MAHSRIWSDPKILILCAVLREPRSHVVGHLEKFWHSCYEHYLEGTIPAAHVEHAAEWEGDDGLFLEAMQRDDVLLLLPTGDPATLELHNFYDNAPDYVKKRMRAKKSKKAAPSAQNGAERRISAPSAQVPNPTQPNGTEEKRQKKEVLWDATSETFQIHPDILTQWAESYPHADISAEVLSAQQWYRDNPAKRKKSHRRFLSGWLRRASERAEASKFSDGDYRDLGLTPDRKITPEEAARLNEEVPW
jgi:hypothetical protein